MLISIKTHLSYTTTSSCSLLLQIEAAQDIVQVCESSRFATQSEVEWNIIPGEENIGWRRWGQIETVFDCTYEAKVRVDRPEVVVTSLSAHPVTQLPSDVTKFLMPSRYCHPEAFLAFIPNQFGTLGGGALIAQMSDWIRENFTYDNGISTAITTATDSFHTRSGVCRDYAHVLIAMARSAGMPARIASVYAPNVDPQDFHAVAEVFLDSAWHIVDPTGMAHPSEIVRIGVGRDAADVSFMTSYGWMEMKKQSVDVCCIG
jgi:transglutaminase-like putative cysteine protease